MNYYVEGMMFQYTHDNIIAFNSLFLFWCVYKVIMQFHI